MVSMNETYRIDRYVAAKKKYIKSTSQTEKLRREMFKAAHLLMGHRPSNSPVMGGQLNALNRMIMNERRIRMASRSLSKTKLSQNMIREILRRA